MNFDPRISYLNDNYWKQLILLQSEFISSITDKIEQAVQLDDRYEVINEMIQGLTHRGYGSLITFNGENKSSVDIVIPNDSTYFYYILLNERCHIEGLVTAEISHVKNIGNRHTFEVISSRPFDGYFWGFSDLSLVKEDIVRHHESHPLKEEKDVETTL